MTDWLLWIELGVFPTWVRESGSIWAYPSILTLHTLGLGLLVGASAVLNLRVLGYAASIPVVGLGVLRRVFGIGLFMNVATGLMLFSADASTKGVQVVFFIKLAAIALALWFTARLARQVFSLAAPPGEEHVASARGLATASLVLWTVAITAGRLMAYF